MILFPIYHGVNLEDINIVPSSRFNKFMVPMNKYNIDVLSSYVGVPELVFGMNLASRKEFINGVLEVAGEINDSGNLEIDIPNQETRKDICEILHTLGITPWIVTKSHRGEYRTYIRIYKENAHDIVFSKKNQVFKYKEPKKDRNTAPVDGNRVAEVLREHFSNRGDARMRPTAYVLMGNVKRCNRISIQSIMNYKEVIGSVPEELDKLIDYTFVKISGKRVVRSEVYDLTVPSNHEFYAQGTYNHNTTCARILAKALNCKHKKANGDACGKCEVCVSKLDESPFYTEHDSSQIRVDNIRGLVDTWYVSMANGYRVIVFDESHLLSKVAQSALLKVS